MGEPAEGGGGSPAAGAAATLQRVKLYRLNDSGVWDDKGPGHVSVEYMEARGAARRRAARRGCCAAEGRAR